MFDCGKFINNEQIFVFFLSDTKNCAIIVSQTSKRDERSEDRKMAMICVLGTKECSFCEECFGERKKSEKISCSVCGKQENADRLRSRGAFIDICEACYNALKYGGI